MTQPDVPPPSRLPLPPPVAAAWRTRVGLALPVRRARPLRVPALLCLAFLFLTAAAPGARQPAAPTRLVFAYAGAVDGDLEILLRASADQPPTNLTRSAGVDLAAHWTPDGSQLVFLSQRDGNREVYAMRADGSEVRNLTENPAQDLPGDVSPDGSELVFFSDRDLPEHPVTALPGHLYVMRLDGSGVRRVTEQPLTSTFLPDWSPDGSSLLFARDDGGNVDLVELDFATGVETRLTADPASEYGGAYSPDGSHIAFHVQVSDDEARLVVIDRDGTNRRELTRGGLHYSPAWTPDGEWISFTRASSGESGFDLLVVPANGGEVEVLLATPEREQGAAFRPQ